MNRNAAHAAWPHHIEPSTPAPNPFQPRQEAQEAPHIANANDRLDRIEQDIKSVLECGGEHALRTRISRLLP